jgi:hypothetical protein
MIDEQSLRGALASQTDAYQGHEPLLRVCVVDCGGATPVFTRRYQSSINPNQQQSLRINHFGRKNSRPFSPEKPSIYWTTPQKTAQKTRQNNAKNARFWMRFSCAKLRLLTTDHRLLTCCANSQLSHIAFCTISGYLTPFSPKPLSVSPCAPMALNLNCGKLKAKKSSFFSGRFDGKSLRNQTKSGKKVSSKCRNFRGIPDQFSQQGGLTHRLFHRSEDLSMVKNEQ